MVVGLLWAIFVALFWIGWDLSSIKRDLAEIAERAKSPPDPFELEQLLKNMHGCLISIGLSADKIARSADKSA